MKISFKRTSTASSFDVVTANCAGFTLVFSLIRRTTQKSEITRLIIENNTHGLPRPRVMIACVKGLGNCPCPRCLIPKERIPQLGKPRDRQQRRTLARVDDHQRRVRMQVARNIIYGGGYAVNAKRVLDFLKEDSAVPTEVRLAFNSMMLARSHDSQSAFSRKLGPLGFNMFIMLVVDLMHEVESGTWRALFIHLLRMLISMDESRIAEVDKR